jgi:erythromycin esterase-like protein
VKSNAVPLRPETLVDSVTGLIGDADIVLIGAATHGTHEFYRLRADLTRALIEYHGFNVLALDADWPDVAQVNRWARLGAEDLSVEDALAGFEAFPRWVWRNIDVARFFEWLHQHNADVTPHGRVGVYGLDVYTLHRAMNLVLRHLGRGDAVAAQRARERYGCIDISGRDSQTHGYAATLGLSRATEHELVTRLVEACHATGPSVIDAQGSAEGQFALEQHARTMSEAEAYYRAMFGSSMRWWNLRDAHMLLTLESVLGHATRISGTGRAVVWAHNVHVGDARACRTEAHGEASFGQLARDRFDTRVRSIAFTTHVGSVTAAAGWNHVTAAMALRPSRRDSYEHLFHETGLPCFALDLHGPVKDVLRSPRLERAVGAVYRPESERWSHYVDASLPLQFDLLVHCDETTAVEPLESWSRRDIDLPETSAAGVGGDL